MRVTGKRTLDREQAFILQRMTDAWPQLIASTHRWLGLKEQMMANEEATHGQCVALGGLPTHGIYIVNSNEDLSLQLSTPQLPPQPTLLSSSCPTTDASH